MRIEGILYSNALTFTLSVNQNQNKHLSDTFKVRIKLIMCTTRRSSHLKLIDLFYLTFDRHVSQEKTIFQITLDITYNLENSLRNQLSASSVQL